MVMNMHVVLLFSNAIIVSIIAAIVVLVILRKEYLPVIKELEKKQLEIELTSNDEMKDK